MKMEKQMSGRQMFAGQVETESTQRNFNNQSLPGSSLSITPSRTVLIYGDSTLPELGPLSTFSRCLRGIYNERLWSLMFLKNKQAK